MKPIQENLPSVFPANIRHFVDHRASGRSHWHEEIELQYVVNGCIQPLCNLQSRILKKGDILFVNSNELHTGNIAPISGEFYCFHINKNFFSNQIGTEHIVFNNVIRDRKCADKLDEVIKTARFDDYKSRLKTCQLLYEFFNLCAEYYVNTVLNEHDFAKHFKRTDKFNDMVKYIEDNFDKDLTVSDIAKEFYVTTSYFAHFFKRRSGKSVIQFLNEARINRAKRYFEQEELSISEVATRVGFDDINYFSRKFKQLTGKTPSEYRINYKAFS